MDGRGRPPGGDIIPPFHFPLSASSGRSSCVPSATPNFRIAKTPHGLPLTVVFDLSSVPFLRHGPRLHPLLVSSLVHVRHELGQEIA